MLLEYCPRRSQKNIKTTYCKAAAESNSSFPLKRGDFLTSCIPATCAFTKSMCLRSKETRYIPKEKRFVHPQNLIITFIIERTAK